MKLILSNGKFYLQIDDKHFIDLSTGGVVTDVKDPIPVTLDSLAAAIAALQAQPKPKPKTISASKSEPKPKPTKQSTSAFVAQLPQFADIEQWLTKITLGFFKDDDSVIEDLKREFGPFGKMLAPKEKLESFSSAMKDKYKDELPYRRYASRVNAFPIPVAIHLAHKLSQNGFNQENITKLLNESPFKDIPYYPILSGTQWAIYAIYPDQSNDFGSFGSDIISYSYAEINIKLVAVVNNTAAYGKFYEAIRAIVQSDPLSSIFLISYLAFNGSRLKMSIVTNAIRHIKSTINKWITNHFYPLPYLCSLTSNEANADCGIDKYQIWKAIFKPLDW